MKCPKCNYVSHDYLDSCRKCGIDLVMFKQDIGLVVLQPGALDLSLVLGGAGTGDLFESIEEEILMHASDDDAFDISLDDYAEQPEVRHAPTGGLHSGRLGPEIDLADMDHLTLELDAADLPDAVTASLRAARMLSEVPATPVTPPPTEPGPGTIPLPGHVTLEMDAESISTDFPPGLLDESVSVEPPSSHAAPQSPATQETTASLKLDISHSDFVPLTSATTPEAERHDAARAEKVDETPRVTDFSGAIASLQLQDVVLADDPAAVVEPEPAVVDPTMPTIQLSYTTMEGAVLTPEVHEPSANDIADVVEPALTTLDESRLQALGRLPSFEDEWAPLTVERMPEDILTSADMFALEDLEETIPPGPLTLELETSVLPADLASNLLEDATSVPPYNTPQLPETYPGTRLEPPLPPTDASIFEGLDNITLPGHLTLELDRSEIASEVSSIILDSLQLEPPPGDMQSQRSPGEDHANDEAELLLDLDNSACDDEQPA